MRSYLCIAIVLAVFAAGCNSQEQTKEQTPTVSPVKPNNVPDNDHAGHDHAGHDHSGHDHAEATNNGEVLVDIRKLEPDTVDVYVKQIQQSLAGVQRIEIDVTNRTLDAGGPGIWKRLDVYKLNDKIVQIEVVPVQGALTETFFYKNWQLVHAFIDLNGMNSSVLDPSETALRYYFNQEESMMPSAGEMGIPTDVQIRQKGNTVLNVAVNTK